MVSREGVGMSVEEKKYKWLREFPSSIPENYVPFEKFRVVRTIPPTPYLPGVVDISLLSCNRPELLEKTLRSLHNWLTTVNTYPINRIRFYMVENSDNQKCVSIGKDFISSSGLLGGIKVLGENRGHAEGYYHLIKGGNGEYVWSIEDDWEIRSPADAIQNWVDILGYGNFIDSIFIQHWFVRDRIYSDSVFWSEKNHIPFRMVTANNYTGIYGKWAMPYFFKRYVMDLIHGPFKSSGRENIEIFYAGETRDKINTAIAIPEDMYVIHHIGNNKRVDVPVVGGP